MISDLLNHLIFIAIFIFVIAWCLFRRRRIDLLTQCSWKALVLMLPLFAFLSLIILGESPSFFFIRIGVLAGILIVFQLMRWLIPFLPATLYSMVNLAGAILRDFFALMTFFILFRSQCWRQTPKKMAGDKIPILMIHGYGHDAGAWIHHAPCLKQAGFGPIYTIDLGSVENSIVDYAKLVQDKAKVIAQERGTSALFLIGYSMGGLVAAYYAFHFAPQDTVQGIMTLGTPLAGTKTAKFGAGVCAKEMDYESSFVQKLKDRIADNTSIPFWHLGSWSETIVRPPSSAWMEGKNSKNIIFDDIGHLSMLYSDRITECMSGILKTIS